MKTLTNISIGSLAVLTLMLTGCFQDEPQNSGEEQTATPKIIGVNAIVTEDAATRAAVIEEYLPDPSFFGIYGYKGNSLYTDEVTIVSPRQVNDVKVNQSGAIQDGDIYWPTTNFSTQAMKFFAYYPYQDVNITSITPSSTGLAITWKTPATADVDLMYASSEAYGAVPTTGLVKGKAELEFNHILSYFKVQARLVDKTVGQNVEIEVTKATLKHMTTGTYTGSTGLWSILGTEATLTKSNLAKDVEKVAEESEDATHLTEFLVIPQSGNGREVKLTYILNEETAERTVTVPYDKLPPFEMGKINILTVTFTVSDTAVEILFGVKVNLWMPGTTGSATENIEI